ncbi:MAG: FHA domain-containing protein [Pseudomonadota bacterium]
MSHQHQPAAITFPADSSAPTSRARPSALAAAPSPARVNEFSELRTLAAERRSQHPAPLQLDRREAVLRLTVPGQRVQQVRLLEGSAMVVGRTGSADLTVRDAALSRTHLRLQLGAEGVELTDLGSTNGSFVRGKMVDRALLQIGERVLFGQSVLEVVRISSCERAAA